MDTVIISTNFWRVPSEQRAFDGFIEGNPSTEERLAIIEEAKAARANWKPSDEGMALVEQLRSFVGFRIQIQFWDSIMWWNEIEGAYPVDADCIGVALLNDGQFLQAYLEVDNLKELPNKEGFSPEAYFQKREGSNFLLAPVADLYFVAKVGSII